MAHIERPSLTAEFLFTFCETLELAANILELNARYIRAYVTGRFADDESEEYEHGAH